MGTFRRGAGKLNGLLIVGALLSGETATGCATLVTLSSDKVEGEMYEHPEGRQSRPRIYAGVYEDTSCVAKDSSGQAGAFCLVDVLFSALGDTVALPFTLYTQLRYGNFHARFVGSIHEHEEALRAERRRRLIAECRRLREKSYEVEHPETLTMCAKVLPNTDLPDGAPATPAEPTPREPRPSP